MQATKGTHQIEEILLFHGHKKKQKEGARVVNSSLHGQDLDGRTSLSTKRKPAPTVVVVEAVASVVVVEVTAADTVVVGGRQGRSQGAQGGVVRQHVEHYETRDSLFGSQSP